MSNARRQLMNLVLAGALLSPDTSYMQFPNWRDFTPSYRGSGKIRKAPISRILHRDRVKAKNKRRMFKQSRRHSTGKK